MDIQIGVRTGKLVVVEDAGTKQDKAGRFRKWVKCRCDCGNVITIRAETLKGKKPTKSCGCLQREAVQKTGRLNKKHGEHKSPEYYVWRSMLQRCHNKNSKDYPRFGGAGVTVCDAWRSSFEAFLRDVGKRPSKKDKLTLIERNTGYQPGNVVWCLDSHIPSLTKLTFEERTLPVRKWAQIKGIPSYVIYQRLLNGWSIERTLTELIPLKITKDLKKQKPFIVLFKNLNYMAETRGISQNLSYDDFVEYTKQRNCCYCGDIIPWKTSYRNYYLDRKDSDKGYNNENCVVCCAICNQTKGSRFSYEEFLIIGAAIAKVRENREKGNSNGPLSQR